MKLIPVPIGQAPNFNQPPKKHNYKIYNDGSHYIARLLVPKSKQAAKTTNVEQSPRDMLFDNLYYNALKNDLKGAERTEYIKQGLQKLFPTNDDTALTSYIEARTERVLSNLYKRKKRFRRKAHLNQWNYFVTITYNDKIHTADTFRRKLRKCLSNLHTRRGWRYMGVFEHGADTDRLHFHALVYVPCGEMIGELITVKDYDKRHGTMQTTIQNTFFNENYGRTDFKEVTQMDLRQGNSINYILKYLGKTNDRIVYSRGIPTEICKPLEENDLVTQMVSDFVIKFVIFDDVIDWHTDVLRTKRKQATIMDLLCNPPFPANGLGCLA